MEVSQVREDPGGLTLNRPMAKKEEEDGKKRTDSLEWPEFG